MQNNKKKNKQKIKNYKDFDEEKKSNKAFKQKKRNLKEVELEELENEYAAIYSYKN